MWTRIWLVFWEKSICPQNEGPPIWRQLLVFQKSLLEGKKGTPLKRTKMTEILYMKDYNLNAKRLLPKTWSSQLDACFGNAPGHPCLRNSSMTGIENVASWHFVCHLLLRKIQVNRPPKHAAWRPWAHGNAHRRRLPFVTITLPALLPKDQVPAWRTESYESHNYPHLPLLCIMCFTLEGATELLTERSPALIKLIYSTPPHPAPTHTPQSLAGWFNLSQGSRDTLESEELYGLPPWVSTSPYKAIFDLWNLYRNGR